jgi:hypothetical protein
VRLLETPNQQISLMAAPAFRSAVGASKISFALLKAFGIDL